MTGTADRAGRLAAAVVVAVVLVTASGGCASRDTSAEVAGTVVASSVPAAPPAPPPSVTVAASAVAVTPGPPAPSDTAAGPASTTVAPTTAPVAVPAPVAPAPAATPAADTVAAAPAIAVPSGAGRFEGRAVVAGVERTWTAWVPAAALHRPVPLVLALHGAAATGAAFAATAGLDVLAEQAGAVVVAPDGYEPGELPRSWNDGRQGVAATAFTEDVDDVGFLAALVEQFTASPFVDAGRVSVMGFSNGAMMAGRLACERADLFHVVVQVAGVAPEGLPGRCRPARPVRLLVVHAVGDPVVPFAGGQVNPASPVPRGRSASVEEWVRTWSAVDGCTGERVEAVAGAATVPPLERRVATGCKQGAVEVDVLAGTAHAWAAGPGVDLTARAWAFVLGG